MADEEVYDSPVDWVARHVRGYAETAGRKGHHKWGAPTLLLTTRTSGRGCGSS
ncbi:MAG TPA: hypothetical protein VFR23_00380 [Jiangellaceae bacterium]|nr:hypothetical protein [Jiangellaceae bacterium]